VVNYNQGGRDGTVGKGGSGRKAGKVGKDVNYGKINAL
jgi:hypothetical protein